MPELNSPNPIEAAELILTRAEQEHVPLRLIGGIAINSLCPSSKSGVLQREYHDVDLVGLSNQTGKIKTIFSDLNYLPDVRFNTLHGNRRLLFHHADSKLDVDIFLDRLMQCHDLDFRKRLSITNRCIPLADLFLSKTQVIRIHTKDIRDIVCILQDYQFTDNDNEGINLNYIIRILSADWGFWKTVMINLNKIEDYILQELGADVFEKSLYNLRLFRNELMVCSKTLRWKLRSLIGERIAWYEDPEEVEALM